MRRRSRRRRPPCILIVCGMAPRRFKSSAGGQGASIACQGRQARSLRPFVRVQVCGIRVAAKVFDPLPWAHPLEADDPPDRHAHKQRQTDVHPVPIPRTGPPEHMGRNDRAERLDHDPPLDPPQPSRPSRALATSCNIRRFSEVRILHGRRFRPAPPRTFRYPSARRSGRRMQHRVQSPRRQALWSL